MGARDLAARHVGSACRMVRGGSHPRGNGPVWGNNRHLPGQEAWLIGEWRTSGERKYTLSNLKARTSLRALAAAIKARWVCEQGHQQLKGELGLGHFEGRSWTGLHRHALMTCIALPTCSTSPRRTPSDGWGKMPTCLSGPSPQPSLPAVRRAIAARLFEHLAKPVRRPHCRRRFLPAPKRKVPR